MKRLLVAVVALPMLAFSGVGCAHPAPPPYYAPPPPGAVANQGYNDGIRAARADMARGRRPRADRHPRFRNPPVPPGAPARIYRENFRRGYAGVYRGGR